jgi:hypothetical protein
VGGIIGGVSITGGDGLGTGEREGQLVDKNLIGTL